MDLNGDGLLDCWKDRSLWSDQLPGISYRGIYDGNIANRDVVLCIGTGVFNPATCADPVKKDLFVEIDYMPPHLPDPVALTQVVAAFTNAPVPPNGPGPIRVHFQLGDTVPHNNTMALAGCTVAAAAGQADFDLLKKQFFGTPAERLKANGQNAKALAFRYAMFAHNLAPTNNTASGCAEIGGNEIAVTLGSWGPAVTTGGHTGGIGTLDHQAGTLMHELGHTLGLRHGGIDNINCKPNYPSVMNYTLQFSNTVTTRPLDFSRVLLGLPVTLPDGTSAIGLNETQLDETQGVGPGFANQKIVFGPVPQLKKPIVVTVPASGAVNWDQDTAVNETGVARDIDQTTSATGGCAASAGEILEGFNDWANVVLNFRGSLDFGDGSRTGIEQKNGDNNQEITLETALELSRDTIDIKPGGDPSNTISGNSSSTVEVAIFSRNDDDGALEFDARDLDPASIILRGVTPSTWQLPVRRANGGFDCKVKDVNNDGLPDIVCKFDFSKNTLSSSDTKAVLEGTIPGPPAQPPSYFFHSSDKIRVTGK